MKHNNVVGNQIIIYSLYLALFFYLFVIQVYYAFDFTIDDAFISLRYAKHLANGHGLYWNIGGVKVEGYSNFLYVIFESLLLKLQLPAIKIIKALSILAMAFSCYGTYLISRLWLPRILAVLPALILLMHPGEILWAVSGLETAFYQALIIFTSYFLLKGHSSFNAKDYNFIFAGVLLALAGLTRPEAPMLFLTFLAIMLLSYYKKNIYQKAAKRQQILRYVISFSLIYGPYFLWRLIYFGRLFPNSVYCKAANAPSMPFDLDLSYLILIIPFMIFSLPYLWRHKEFKHNYLLAPSLVYLIALYNADWIVGYWDRHFLAVYALLLPIFICGLKTIFSSKKSGLTRKWLQHCVIIYGLICGFLFSYYRYTPANFNYVAQNARSGNELRTQVAYWLNKNTQPNYKITVGDCGLIPFLYNGYVIDSYCLNSANFTKKPINYSYQKFANWILNSKKPELIILMAFIKNNNKLYSPFDIIILNDKRFKHDYKIAHHADLIQANKISKKIGYQYIIYSRKIT